MQLILHLTTPSYDTWKTAFDADAENRAAAGLTMMQIWRGADDAGEVTVLFSVSDRKRAQDWLDKEAGFGRTATAHFLKTA
ncbi:MAG: hypothetical protein V4712_07505 [Pseudomonadota bacterium]